MNRVLNEQDGVHLTIVDTYLLFIAFDYVKMGWLDGYAASAKFTDAAARKSRAICLAVFQGGTGLAI